MMEIRLKSTYLELLFVCLCLLTVLGPANGETVVRVTEGSEAVLPCLIRPERNITGDVFDWKKDGQKEVFFYERGKHYNNGRVGQDEQFKGRVSHLPDQLKSGNASIVIRDTESSDSGTYSCDFSPAGPNRETFTIELVVVCIIKDRSEEKIPGASIKPHITSLNHTKDKAQLQCEVQGVSPKPKVEWQNSDGNNLTVEEPQVTERGGSYDIILQTTVNKTDNFRCVVTQEEICHQVSAETAVYIHGAATEVCVTILEETKDSALLQCVVRGASTKPEVTWQDSSGNILPAKEPKVTERGGGYDIILKTTVTEGGQYHCVVTQEENKDHTKAEIFVLIGGSPTGLIAAAVVAALLFVVLLVVLCVLFKVRRRSLTSRNYDGSHCPQKTERAERGDSHDLDTLRQQLQSVSTDRDEQEESIELDELNKKSDTSEPQ